MCLQVSRRTGLERCIHWWLPSREVRVPGRSSLLRILALVLALMAGLGAPTPFGAIPRAEAQAESNLGQPGVATQSVGDLPIGVIVDTTNPRSMQLASDDGFSHAKM